MKEKISSILDALERDKDINPLSTIIYFVEHELLPVGFPPQALQPATLGFIRVMLENGFLAIDSPYLGAPEAWANQDPDYVCMRIEQEWTALGREPNPDEIVWFKPPAK